MTPDGLSTCPSSHGPKETMDRLAAAVAEHGMSVLARFDHAAAATQSRAHIAIDRGVHLRQSARRHTSDAGGPDEMNSTRAIHGINVMREGRIVPLVPVHPDLTSAAVGWRGIALEDHTIQACTVPRHEHIENFLLVVLGGSAKYEVLTGGKTLDFDANPGTTFVLPRGTVDEVRWKGPTRRLTVAFDESLLINAVDETSHERYVELTEHWNLTDPEIMAVLLAMTTDLNAGSLAGRLYGESLANALAIYLLKCYAARQYTPVAYRYGLPAYRLNRVLGYIDDNLADDLGLSELASIAGMSPHYFAELFKQSTGQSPYRYVLLRRIERAKQSLRDPNRNVLEVGLDSGFKNASHFARVFRKLVGTTPSRFRSELYR